MIDHPLQVAAMRAVINNAVSERECIERVMTLHWDMCACRCGVCEYGRKHGYGPQERYLKFEAEARNLQRAEEEEAKELRRFQHADAAGC